MFIDSHQHYWQIGKHGHEWPTPDLAPIYHDFGVDDLVQQSATLDLVGSVAVQSQPSDLDTDWLLQLASQHDLIKGVVGWVELSASNASERLTMLAKHQKLKGVRPMLQSMSDSNWILREEVQPALKKTCDLQLRFDALVFTRQLPAIAELAARYPELSIVIDHAAKPPIAARDVEATRQWKIALSRCAEKSNVHCKLSGLFTEMNADQSRDEATPFVDHVFDIFGSDRVMWGSDWPVVKLRNSYAEWHQWTRHYLQRYTDTQRSDIMHDNACRFYSL